MKKLLTLVLLVAFLAFQGTAYAKLVSGKVDSTDATANTLTITHTNPTTGAEEKVTVSVKADTTFSGVAALADLKAGDRVWVDAKEGATPDSWDATSVQVLKSLEPTTTEAPAQAPETAATTQ